MSRKFRKWMIAPLFAAVIVVPLLAADEPWKDKKAAEWTEDDAKVVVSHSPWAKTVTPQFKTANGNGGFSSGIPGGGGRGRGGGRRGGINIGGIPGVGGGNRGGRGNTGTGYPGQQGRGDQRETPPTLTVRWESAAPIRQAELKARETDAPDMDDSHYAIAVYGVPSRTVTASKDSLSTLQKHAVLKRDGKKDFKPSSVKVLARESGTVIVYFFPRSKEITKSDSRVEFDAEIGKLTFSEAFYTEDMQYNGRLEI